LIVGAVVLAADKSWQTRSKRSLEEIFEVLDEAGVEVQVVVVGSELQAVVEVIRARLGRVKIALNLDPTASEVSLFQTGLIVISIVDAAFLIRGEQQIDAELLESMIKVMEQKADASLVSPINNPINKSPLLFRKTLFTEILTLSSLTIQDFVQAHKDAWVTVEPAQRATQGAETSKS
jgi:CTP:molybdopterin cytidylyltransferase MocA